MAPGERISHLICGALHVTGIGGKLCDETEMSKLAGAVCLRTAVDGMGDRFVVRADMKRTTFKLVTEVLDC